MLCDPLSCICLSLLGCRHDLRTIAIYCPWINLHWRIPLLYGIPIIIIDSSHTHMCVCVCGCQITTNLLPYKYSRAHKCTHLLQQNFKFPRHGTPRTANERKLHGMLSLCWKGCMLMKTPRNRHPHPRLGWSLLLPATAWQSNGKRCDIQRYMLLSVAKCVPLLLDMGYT